MLLSRYVLKASDRREGWLRWLRLVGTARDSPPSSTFPAARLQSTDLRGEKLNYKPVAKEI